MAVVPISLERGESSLNDWGAKIDSTASVERGVPLVQLGLGWL